MSSHVQPSLFDSGAFVQAPEVAAARGRMRDTILGLKAADVPPWTDEMGVILRDGAFKRAMYLVPADEAAVLWREYDAEMERLYAVWVSMAEV